MKRKKRLSRTNLHGRSNLNAFTRTDLNTFARTDLNDFGLALTDVNCFF
jgi:hypothetical protein